MSEDRFGELMERAILDLPQHMKETLRVVEDPDVDDESRVALAGALLHILGRNTAIPGVREPLQYVGHAMLMRLALESAKGRSPDAIGTHAEGAPRLIGQLEECLQTARDFLGDGMSVLEKVRDGLPKANHQGHDAKACVHDEESSNWLYDAVHEALVETLEIDEDEVAREIKRVDQIQRSLQARAKRG